MKMTDDALDLRSYALIPRLAPQCAAVAASVALGDVPAPGMAQLYLEVAPGSSVMSLLDVGLKAADVAPAFQILEREFGLIELHSTDVESVQAAGAAMLDAAGLERSDRMRPRVISEYVISRVTHHQAQLVNRERHGAPVLAEESLFVLEMEPAGYVPLVANAAEIGVKISVVNFDPVGRFGRLYLSGDHSSVASAREIALTAAAEGGDLT